MSFITSRIRKNIIGTKHFRRSSRICCVKLVLSMIRNGYGMTTRNNIALSGLSGFYPIAAQGSASLHPGLRVHRGSATNFIIVVSVKGGENVSVAMVRDLAHVV